MSKPREPYEDDILRRHAVVVICQVTDEELRDVGGSKRVDGAGLDGGGDAFLVCSFGLLVVLSLQRRAQTYFKLLMESSKEKSAITTSRTSMSISVWVWTVDGKKKRALEVRAVWNWSGMRERISEGFIVGGGKKV